MTGTQIEYSCSDCGVAIGGETWDIQESPRLHCPECEQEMELQRV